MCLTVSILFMTSQSTKLIWSETSSTPQLKLIQKLDQIEALTAAAYNVDHMIIFVSGRNNP
jgi:hypothetical protein